MNTRPNFILSTVGTSLLTNLADSASRKALTALANLRDAELTDDQRRLIDDHVRKARALLQDARPEAIRAASAELNGIFGLYDDRPPSSSADQHVLIATDTAMGRITAETVRDFLLKSGVLAVVEVIPALSTRDQGHFGEGIRTLVGWCSKTLPGYREGYRVIFNLVGGFKSLQGYLNTIGMIYADEIVYLFEGPSPQLIRIPRLPIRIDLQGLSSWRSPLALMAAGLAQPADRLLGCPEVMLDEVEPNGFLLSVWGALIWNEQKEAILADEPLDLPRLRYAPGFLRDFRGHDTTRNRVQLQETLARVARLLEESDGDRSVLFRDGSLHHEKLLGKLAGLEAFRVALGLRVECRPTPQGLELLSFGEKEGRYRH